MTDVFFPFLHTLARCPDIMFILFVLWMSLHHAARPYLSLPFPRVKQMATHEGLPERVSAHPVSAVLLGRIPCMESYISASPSSSGFVPRPILETVVRTRCDSPVTQSMHFIVAIMSSPHSSRPDKIRSQCPVELLYPNRHF